MLCDRLDGRSKKILSAPLDDPAFQLHTVFCRVFAIGQPDRALRVILFPLANDSIDSGAFLANKFVLAVRKAMIARPS